MKTTHISTILTTNCTIVEMEADIQTIRDIFNYFPNRFLPVVEGLRFIGVILREEFLQQYMLSSDKSLTAAHLVSKEIIKLGTWNSIAQAKELFDTKVFDVIPVVDEDGDLAGVLLRDDVESAYAVAGAGVEAEPENKGWRKILSFLSL